MAETPAVSAVLVDSDVLIEVLRQRDALIQSRWTVLADSGTPVFYSPITAAEIWRGVRAEEENAVEMLFSVMECVPIDAGIGRKAGDYLRRYHLSHHLELADALIAATAALHHVPLWTRNRKHYPMRDVRLL